ncbi:unnamed protein product [Peniophora sp. CBMAI 1063]|nr:unnamed protein product [Peniophora sp. CBMAI 1063]
MRSSKRSVTDRPRWKLSARARRELEVQANVQFRSIVRRAAHRMDVALVDQLRLECELHGVQLIGPRLQYRAHDPNRGRYYVVSSAPYPGRKRKMFRYVSGPLPALKIQELEDARIARELQDEGLRPVHLGMAVRTCSSSLLTSLMFIVAQHMPLGHNAFMRALGLDVSARTRGASRVTTAPRPLRRLNPVGGQHIRVRVQSPPRTRSASIEIVGQRRARSPSIEIVDAPPVVVVDLTQEPLFLRVKFYDTDGAAPKELLLEQSFPGAPYRLSEYAPQFNSIDVKLSDSAMLLMGSQFGPSWRGATIGDLGFPPTARRVVIARRLLHSSLGDNVARLHDSVHHAEGWGYKGLVLTAPIEID